jgi:hypothetical protein
VEIIDRSSVNAFDDERVARAIAATGRKKLIFAGISLEVCAAFPAITAVGKGLDAYVAVDASGTFSETKRQVGLLRMLQAGVILSDYATLMVEILKDNARPEAGEVYGGHGYALGQTGGPNRPRLREEVTVHRAGTGSNLISPVEQGRFDTTEDIAEAVPFLASDCSDMITGHLLSVDGGMLTGFGEDFRAIVRKRMEGAQCALVRACARCR